MLQSNYSDNLNLFIKISDLFSNVFYVISFFATRIFLVADISHPFYQTTHWEVKSGGGV